MRAGRAFTSAQAAAAAVVLARFARGRRRRAPLTAGPATPPPDGAVSVVVPARDEAARLAPCLAGLRGDPDVAELLVVDDRSSDATAEVAAAGGARVLPGAPLPAGWAGKAWALHQGAEAATGAWVLFLDADTRPRPGWPARSWRSPGPRTPTSCSAGPRFLCPGVAERLLHPAMAATIAYRTGPSDVPGRQPSPARAIVNGQCLLVRRRAFAAWGGWERVRGHLTEDVALARALRGDGRRVAFADGADLLDVRMYEGARETWSGWGRSLMGPDVNGPLRQAEDLAVLWLALALPLPRLLLRRGTPLDALLRRGAARHHGRARALLPPARRAVLALPAGRRARDGPPDVVGAAPRPHLARTHVLTYGAGMGAQPRDVAREALERRIIGGDLPPVATPGRAAPGRRPGGGPRRRSARPSRASSATAWPAPTATASSSRRSTAAWLREAYPIALLLEGLAVRSAPPLPDRALDRLRAINDELRVLGPADARLAAERDFDFHDELVAACGNEHLLETVRPMKRRLIRYERTYMADAEVLLRSAAMHDEIVDHLARGDHESAAIVVEENFRSALPSLLEHLEAGA